MTGEIVDAEYDEDSDTVQYTFELDDGTQGEAKLTRRSGPWGAILSDDAMRQLADQLPGVPVRDETDAGIRSGQLDEYSIAWGSGAQGDVDDPAPARGARRCDECDEWTSEYADECSRCGGDPYADSRGDV